MFKRDVIGTVFLAFYVVVAVIGTCNLLYAGEESKKQSVEKNEQIAACCGPEDYVDIIPDILPFFREKEEGEFDLARYYDDLEPPGQDGVLGRYSVLGEDALYFLVPAFAVLGSLYALPEGVSNWDRDEINWKDGSEKWRENITAWEVDDDADWINYIGHPYFGSSYYIYARHYGYSRLESFWFSFAVSTCYETALEAWAEPVSIQDMIVTPLLGWGLGELLLPLEHSIKQNDNKVFNSSVLGSISLFLIDPFGHVILPLKAWSKRMFSDDAEVALSPILEYQTRSSEGKDTTSGSGERYGLVLTVQW
jgi:hypothetical protein